MTRAITIGAAIVVSRCRTGTVLLVSALLLASLITVQPARGERIDSGGRCLTVEAAFVIDGDSIMVKKDSRDIEVRLFGIDAPEYDQPGSKAARRHLAALVDGKELLLEVMDHDIYGRTVALASIGAMSVNEELIRAGQAWVHPRYCRLRVCARWLDHQRQAAARKAGLWRQQRPVPPWRWKAQKAARR